MLGPYLKEFNEQTHVINLSNIYVYNSPSLRYELPIERLQCALLTKRTEAWLEPD